MPALAELEEAWVAARDDAGFRAELDGLLRDFVGRPSPLYLAHRLSEVAGRRLYLKREDLNHTGAHKINNAIGQALLARRMGKRRIIAETGAGQHGVATATACALMDLECVVYMGVEDIRRQAPNVQRMELLGATVSPVDAGARTLKEASSEAIRDWVTNVATTHYIIGSAVGPAPYPAIVRDLQRVIGDEARAQILEREGRLPDRVDRVRRRRLQRDRHLRALRRRRGRRAHRRRGAAARRSSPAATARRSPSPGAPACCTDRCRPCCRTRWARSSRPTRSRPAWTIPGSGPEHAHLRDIGRARYLAVTDAEALETFRRVTRLEGIIPALETAHALHYALAPADSELDIVCCSGRGDKDLAEVLGQA